MLGIVTAAQLAAASKKGTGMDKPDPWEYILENERRLRNICRIGSRGRRDLEEELWSDVVLVKVPRCIELWDEVRPLWTYVAVTIRAYVWKYVNKRLQHGALEQLNERSQVVEYSTRLEVIEILESLSHASREILYLKYMNGCTTEEISVYYDVSMGTAHTMIHKALEEAREIWT